MTLKKKYHNWGEGKVSYIEWDEDKSMPGLQFCHATGFNSLTYKKLLEPLSNWNDPEEGNLSQKDHEYLMSTDFYKNKKETCSFVFYSLIIHSDLKVSICCVDWEKKTLIGDLKKEKLKDIWNGDKLKYIQLKHINKRRCEIEVCKNCTYLHTAQDNLDSLTEEQFLSRF